MSRHVRSRISIEKLRTVNILKGLFVIEHNYGGMVLICKTFDSSEM